MSEERRSGKDRRTKQDRREFDGPVPEVFDRRDLEDPKDRRTGEDRRKDDAAKD
jgi:hypothetical protein